MNSEENNEEHKRDIPAVLYKAGLGDIIRRIYDNEGYKYISETTTPVRVILASSNPFASEIFRFHKNAKNFIIEDLGNRVDDLIAEGLSGVKLNQALCALVGIHPSALKRQKIKGYEPIFYAPDNIASTGHIVFQPFAGIDGRRTFKEPFIERIVEVLRRQPCKVFLITRSYIRKGKKGIVHSEENAERFAGGNITVLNNLSVPATLNLVKSCSAFIGSWSSLQQAAWLENKPVALFYPKNYIHVVNHKEKPDGYGFGLDRDDCLHSDFQNADMEKLSEWFKRWYPTE